MTDRFPQSDPDESREKIGAPENSASRFPNCVESISPVSPTKLLEEVDLLLFTAAAYLDWLVSSCGAGSLLNVGRSETQVTGSQMPASRAY